MDIFQLIDRQRTLEDEITGMKKQFPLGNKEDCMRYAALKKEVADIESRICSIAEAVDDGPSADYSEVTEAFAGAINEAAENGIPVEEVILGEDSILDVDTVSCMFKTIRSGGKLTVIGGELVAQCKKFPWLLIKIDCDRVEGEPVWSSCTSNLRPMLQNCVSGGFHLDGSFQRGMLAFFLREYARQQERLGSRS